jgi:DNA-binding transcriptional LysR family regulator
MEILQLETFLAILEHGSFSRAAEVLHCTQSTVSFRIKALEDSVGTVLIERRARPLRPTAGGALLRGHAERMVAERDEALSRLRERAAGGAGQLVVAASTIAAAYLLPPALATLRTHSPGIHVSVEVSDSSRALAALRTRECDLAVVGARDQDKRLIQAPIATDEILLVARPDLAEAWGAPSALEALRKAPLILREEGSGTLGAVADILAHRAAAGPSGPTVRVGSSTAARQCLLAGLGVSFISRMAVREDLELGRLVPLVFPGTPVTRRFIAARLRAAEPSGPLLELLRALAEDRYRNDR